MGYCVTQGDTAFRIKAENKTAALAAVKGLLGSGKETHDPARWGQKGDPYFSWVDNNELRAAETLEAALSAWGWKLQISGATTCPTCGRNSYGGNVTGITFEQEKLGDEAILFQALAPFIEAGSYIGMRGEDGETWRWCFNGETMTEKRANVTWE